MTPDEKSLYAMTLFDMHDEVTIDDEIDGVVTGIRVIDNGEDEYRVFYFDLCGNPQQQWWSASHLESCDDDGDGNSNVVPFPCACERADITAAKHATRH